MEKGIANDNLNNPAIGSVLDSNSRTGAYYRQNYQKFTDEPVKPTHKVPATGAYGDGAHTVQDANGDIWALKHDGWKLDTPLKAADPEGWANLHPDNKAEWNRENPDTPIP